MTFSLTLSASDLCSCFQNCFSLLWLCVVLITIFL